MADLWHKWGKHPFIITTSYPLWVVVGLEPFQADTGREVEFTLGTSPACRKDNTERQTAIHFEWPVRISLDCGRKLKHLEETFTGTKVRGEGRG